MSTALDPRRILNEIDPNEVRDILDEVGHKNYVMVSKTTVKTYRGRTRTSTDVVDAGNAGVKAAIPSLLHIDALRVAKGRKPMFLDAALKRSGSRLISVTFNLRTNDGINFAADALGTSGTQPATANWIALSSNTSGASATHGSDTVPWSSSQGTNDASPDAATGEVTFGGLARAVATYNHTPDATSYTQSKTWTSSDVHTSLVLAGMFGGSSKNTQGASVNNILFVENTFTATSLVSTDQLTLTWTINI